MLLVALLGGRNVVSSSQGQQGWPRREGGLSTYEALFGALPVVSLLWGGSSRSWGLSN